MSDPLEANQRALVAELSRVVGYLEARAEGGEAPPAAAHERPPALEQIVDAFGLSAFERDVLLLCAGVELEGRFLEACGAAAGADGPRRPTFGLALASLPEPHWSALAPAAPLRRAGLVELEPAATITSSPLCIDERVLHHLTGLDYLADGLRGVVAPLEPQGELPHSMRAAADRIVAAWTAAPRGPLPAIVLCGRDAGVRRRVAAEACAHVGLRAHVMSCTDVPAHAGERVALADLWEREAALGAAVLILEVEEALDAEPLRSLAAFADAIGGGLVIAAREPFALRRRTAIRVDVATPTRGEQLDLWRAGLGERAGAVNGSLDALASQFDLGPQAIAAAAAQVAGGSDAELGQALREACRAQARPRLDDLANRIEPRAGWDDLVVEPGTREALREVAAQVRHRAQVYDEWGFAGKSARGLGISALFEGPSGTGKTTAAEVLARELDLDLYRIDLSQVVSKYIGDTEKNLRRVFDAAESGAAILLFDEADALFGKRSEVRDSHDRYANVEVSYLLQRMEDYRGLAILTTNLPEALDKAFLRRIRFVVRFRFPDAQQRAEIWRRTFPVATPSDGLEPEKLARLSVSGGSIRNIALHAVFQAAEAREPVRMDHLARAAARECSKLERPLTAQETAGWT